MIRVVEQLYKSLFGETTEILCKVPQRARANTRTLSDEIEFLHWV